MNKLLILPFDHRSSFEKSIAQTDDFETIKHLKGLIFKAFVKVWEKYPEKETLSILIDDKYGCDILAEAKTKGINVAVAIEKSGSDTFEFEHGEGFGNVLNDINPTYVKVLIRYNPENEDVNKTQLQNLGKLSLYCQETGRRIILELLVPPMGTDLESQERYEQRIRPAKTIQAINEIATKINPHIWKMEGFSKENWELIFSQIPFDMNVIVLGRGEDEGKVEQWLTDAAHFNNIIGFAVGRTVFSQPIIKCKTGELNENQTIDMIASNFERLITLWNSQKANPCP